MSNLWQDSRSVFHWEDFFQSANNLSALKMGGLYRSEDMLRCQIIMANDVAFSCVAELGEMGIVQFIDANTNQGPLQRKFALEVRRCDELEKRIRYISAEVDKAKLPMTRAPRNVSAVLSAKESHETRGLEHQLLQLESSDLSLRLNRLEMLEMKLILDKADKILDDPQEVDFRQKSMKISFKLSVSSDSSKSTGGYGYGSTFKMPRRLLSVVGPPRRGSVLAQVMGDIDTRPGAALIRCESTAFFLAGVIAKKRLAAFETMIWRTCRGLVFVRQEDITEPLFDPLTNEDEYKSVIFLFFQGEGFKTKVKKICDGFHAKLYHIPESVAQRRKMTIGIMGRIKDLDDVLKGNERHRIEMLQNASKHVETWRTRILKQKAIYHVLNQLSASVTPNCLIAECWIPAYSVNQIQDTIRITSERFGGHFPPLIHAVELPSEAPPTHFNINKFTRGFQNIVDSYGVPNYKEINPTLFTISSFPFLFAIMFGDVGHGLIMALFAAALILKEKSLTEKRIRDEIFQTLFGGRYIILLMGIFSIYVGFIYNELFSRPMNMFGSVWRPNYDLETLAHHEKLTLDPNSTSFLQRPYPFGVDPVWMLAENKLLYFNSFKMKMSVVMGILQMLFGVLLGLLNHIHFKRTLDILCQSIPEIIFLSCLFLYLCVLIVLKWTLFGAHAHGEYPGPNCSPSLLIGFINMFMMKARQQGYDGDACHLAEFYPSQTTVERILVLVAILCIPVMLFVKPIILYKKHKKRVRQFRNHFSMRMSKLEHHTNNEIYEYESETLNPEADDTKETEEHSFGDYFIHQAIHTIEFSLGCVSHTASYLRLWALSLAHSELSEVLWHMVLSKGISLLSGYAGAAVIFVAFAAFAVLTIAILIVMEGLSAFLHALRLHWVEFNSKFYGGEGTAFNPFNLRSAAEADNNNSA